MKWNEIAYLDICSVFLFGNYTWETLWYIIFNQIIYVKDSPVVLSDTSVQINSLP